MIDKGVTKWSEQEPDGSSGFVVFDMNTPGGVEMSVEVDGDQIRVDWERVEQEAEQ